MTRDSLIDQMAGNYRLVAKLGAGGMGEVYKAVHEQIGSRVAIKILHATQAHDRAAEERFLLEAKAVNRIVHPGVVKVIDAGRMANGRPFLVMELLDGASLHELRKAGKLAMPDACRAIVDALDAVAAAHAAGVVHRDLKPPNIFRTRDGRTVVLDFGIAKLMAADANVQLTMTGSAIGTPHYMSPEQIRGLPITPAVDIYAAGVVLFELLCNRRPFEAGDDASVFAAHLENRPPPPRALEPSIPVAVQDVILTALAKDPAKRFASAAAMRDALRSALADPETAATIPRAKAPAATVVDRPKPELPTAEAATVAAKPARAELATVAAKLKSAAKPAARPLDRNPPRRTRAIWFASGAIVLASAAIAIAVIATRQPTRKATPEPKIEPRVTSPIEPRDAPDLTDPWVEVDARSATAASVDAAAADPFDDLFADAAMPDAAIRVKPVRPRPDARAAPPIDVEPFGDDFGSVVITSVPTGATVYIDSKIVGDTPWSGRATAGERKLLLVLDGYRFHNQTIHVEKTGLTKINATLTKN